MIQEIRVDICDRDIKACHPLKDKDQTIVKFINRKDCLRILRVKRQVKGFDPSAVELPEGTKISLMRACALTIEGMEQI